MPYLGRWGGRFIVERAGPGAIGGARRNDLKGDLQHYRTRARFELRLEGEQFAVTAGGSWSQKAGRVTLSPTSVKVDDGGGEEARNPNKAWIDPKALSAAYSRPLSLRLSKDGKTLTGLPLDVGPLVGVHSFVRSGFGT